MLDPTRETRKTEFKDDDFNVFFSEFLMGSLFVLFFLMQTTEKT